MGLEKILDEFRDILEKHINSEIVQVSHKICWEGFAIKGQIVPNTSDNILLFLLKQYPGSVEVQDGNLYAVRYLLTRNKENEAWAAKENFVRRFPDEDNADQFWVWAGVRSFDESRMLLIKVAEHVKAALPLS